MAKQLTSQKFIFKIHSNRLRQAKWDLILSMSEAAKNEELIKLSDSQVMRFINDINGTNTAEIDRKVKELKKALSFYAKEDKTKENRQKVKEVYAKLNDLQFVPEYLCVIMDNKGDYKRACSNKAFKVNGLTYRRFVGTTNGVKKKTIVFICERNANDKEIFNILSKRVNNGRNEDSLVVPAKFEAYKALACSSSLPVSMPNGVVVVKDCFTSFKGTYIKLDDSSTDEPVMTIEENQDIEFDASDGYGLIMPEVAERWSKEIKEDYVFSGCCIRNSYCKGMLFPFDFHEFADRYGNGNYTIIDIWGQKQDIRKVEMILTDSMLKLWNNYESMEQYLGCCKENGFTFAITKISPERLENVRNVNYQFLQSYNLSDDDIYSLCLPTINEIKSVLGDDVYKAILFLKGMGLSESNINGVENDFAKALMINPNMINDPFVRGKIYYLIKKRITEAKIGCLRVNGNFQIISGDPFALCQSTLGLPVTGLLKANECYSRYWVDKESKKVACFRAPMSCHNNIRVLNVSDNEDVQYWFRYMKNIFILSVWDMTTMAENGCDYDGDLFYSTDNEVLVNKFKPLPAIMCVQKTATKVKITEANLQASNLNGFGDDIGTTTNHITAMFDVKSQYSPNSQEYKDLEYRIMCGQLYQQNCIDRVKGIITKPMPQEWYNRESIKIKDTDSPEAIAKKKYNETIIADRKPYFMSYIYPEARNAYKKYLSDTNERCLFEFGLTFDELESKVNKTERESEFLKYYDEHIPLGMNDCTMNRICRLIECEFSKHRSLLKETTPLFDYSILKSDVAYSPDDCKAIGNLYYQYRNKLKEYNQKAKSQRIESTESTIQREIFKREFKQQAYCICPNEDQLCDIVLDICYTKTSSKQFAWDICGNVFIKNLLKKSENMITYLESDKEGKIEYCGEYFTVKTKKLGSDATDDYTE